MRRFLPVFIIMINLSCIGLTGGPRAQTLDEWNAALKQAKDRKGCASIPYPNNCDAKQRQMHGHCDMERSCQDFDPEVMLKNIDGLSSALKKWDEEKSALHADSDQERIKTLEDLIYNGKRRLDEMNTKLTNDKTKVQAYIYNNKVCLEDRSEVQEEFAKAVSMAERETDPEIVTIAKDLISFWINGNGKHGSEYEGVEEVLKLCEDLESKFR